MPTVTINPDKTISINGKKTFMTIMSDICNEWVETKAPCSTGLSIMKNITMVLTYSNYEYTVDKIAPLCQANGILFTRPAWGGAVSEPLRSHPNFFGYIQCDEPLSVSTNPMSEATQAICEATKVRCNGTGVWRDGKCYYPDMTPHVRDTYNNLHTKDPGNPVILNLWEKMLYWSPYCDIISWDSYPYIYGFRYEWPRGQSLYAYEISSERNFFKGTDPNTIKPSVFAFIQALGKPYSEGARSYYVLTPNEVRALTYTTICMDVKGILFWSWSHADVGLSTNPILAAYYNQIAGEIKMINDVLVGETVAYKWYARNKNGSSVTFSATKTIVLNGKTINNWSYILKRGLDGLLYLIVVNKDASPMSNINININITGLSSNVITTIGLETSGSSQARRILTMTDGSFTDSFDGLAVHIYQIGEETCSPPQCDFTITQ